MERNLKKELTLLDIFCVAAGAMISSGLFILPGLAFAKAGPAVILSYLVAGIFCIPALLSMAELSTAMPRAGGDYFYIMRGFGPLLGTVAGFSTWFSLSLKAAFALIGVGAYLSVIIRLPVNVVALVFCLAFILLNLAGVKEAGRIQVVLFFGLLAALLVYIFLAADNINLAHLSPFFTKGIAPLFSTASFVFISYGGLVKVAALAEETKSPGRNIPLGMIFALAAVSVLYASVIFVTIGVVDPENLKVTLTPVSDGASVAGGDFLRIIVSIGALLAFITTANAGIMSASRYPLGMSRDRLLPPAFQQISPKFKTPHISILVTGLFMALAILFLKLDLLVKIASTVLILLYLFGNLTVILFRESRILSYKPKFYSPAYPYMQIFGILGGLFLLVEMGSFILFLTGIFLFLGVVWYKVYAQKRATQDSALIYALEKLVARDKELATEGLLNELKDIVIQRDEVIEDKFHKLIEQSQILDVEAPLRAEDLFKEVSELLSAELQIESRELIRNFLARENESSTVLRKGLAIPHIIVEGKNIFKILLVRAKTGVIFPNDELAHVIFILVGSSDERNLHLKVLAAIAQITQVPEFDKNWLAASSKEDLRNIVLLAERRRG
ncbi:MAG: amino acid permease [Candidatus Omnitrophota bacterium]|jgi:amino acid transporter/mannitol/fructose-specific phosphotransferase system IIA component (Ntr-type)